MIGLGQCCRNVVLEVCSFYAASYFQCLPISANVQLPLSSLITMAEGMGYFIKKFHWSVNCHSNKPVLCIQFSKQEQQCLSSFFLTISRVFICELILDLKSGIDVLELFEEAKKRCAVRVGTVME